MNNPSAITFSGIRPGEEADIVRLIGQSGLVVSDITPEKLKMFIAAREKGRVIGVAGIEIVQDNALLRSVCVSEPNRNQGIATRLVTATERSAKSLGVETLYLLTPTAESFFSKIGFEKTDRQSVPEGMQKTREFQTLCPAAAVCMKKRILSPSKGLHDPGFKQINDKIDKI